MYVGYDGVSGYVFYVLQPRFGTVFDSAQHCRRSLVTKRSQFVSTSVFGLDIYRIWIERKTGQIFILPVKAYLFWNINHTQFFKFFFIEKLWATLGIIRL